MRFLATVRPAALLTLAAAMLPAASGAQSPTPAPSPSSTATPAPTGGTTSITLVYKAPPGWARVSSVGPGTSYVVQDGDKVHTLTFAAVSPKLGTQVDAYAADRISAERQRGAEVVDEGSTTACEGEPAHRWTILSASTGVATETKVLATTVTGGIATATYTHRQGVGDRRDGLDAMGNLCPGPFPNPVPAGWTAPKARFGITLALDSPDATSTFVASYRVMAADRFEVFERDALPKGTVVADRREPCGAGQMHRVDVKIGGQIAEITTTYLHGAGYRYVYTRPASHDADAGAERALSAFCRGASPLSNPASAPV
ncbi:MAG: hypothetical protein JWO85_2278 [Candidatus Eremiobacteraeota bacterium]|jgi:hypothetical protein|nr:hypothetical protein [Candidatus Eremiobacteraeota bacterium]